MAPRIEPTEEVGGHVANAVTAVTAAPVPPAAAPPPEPRGRGSPPSKKRTKAASIWAPPSSVTSDTSEKLITSPPSRSQARGVTDVTCTLR
eukprot:CAMPEP_0181332590 /NCGR_PEP_ID=MMETSP1101-20121128/25188_1 /TAXON_ID=46948 /ORGANISM="Rhodomonas abbreviata, Strain Caron Lab Isolate" /LENGTH=90 /DNA_ID=CAMNT_0023442271 /DNA_START=210 /DNA_END=479 /DNA_ORIENTATION=-